MTRKYGERVSIENTGRGYYLVGNVPGGRPNGEGLVLITAMGAGLGRLGLTPDQYANRIRECVNACADIDDPDAWIPYAESCVEACERAPLSSPEDTPADAVERMLKALEGLNYVAVRELVEVVGRIVGAQAMGRYLSGSRTEDLMDRDLRAAFEKVRPS